MARRKKKNYRLRKSVRRTLGALFMISAIIVAAIPFPDAAATNGVQSVSGGNAGETETQKPTLTEIPTLVYDKVVDPTLDTTDNKPKSYDREVNEDIENCLYSSLYRRRCMAV